MIWQWMDGVVSREGITADLEAYREAGIGGVQQFQVGGPMQTAISDTTQAIGTVAWQTLMKHALGECDRLGLSFGTHNCPGWSSSAYPTVEPRFAMQKLVCVADTVTVSRPNGTIQANLPQSEGYKGFYRDIAIVALPADMDATVGDVMVLSRGSSLSASPTFKLPTGKWIVLRIGHTCNGNSNYGTAPYGGRGLECDKMSREAVERYWNTYPTMLLQLMPELNGRTFLRMEIDSYEAGGQEWTERMPEEFQQRHGYDVIAYLPLLLGYDLGNGEEKKRFMRDYQHTVRSLFAENYYGYMSELVHQTEGMTLLAQPYGTSSSRPFNPIDTRMVTAQLHDDDAVCAEFWTHPNWGWPEVPKVVSAANATGHSRVWAEGFTCWPKDAWQDGPDQLKRTADRAFCLGVNNVMLHAAAQNPWPNAVPGMTFGMWGTQWTQRQTWWRSGGAKALFAYMARCQALLQRGVMAGNHASADGSLSTTGRNMQWTHRRDGENDIFFVSNTADTAQTVILSFNVTDRRPTIFHPERGTIGYATAWLTEGDSTRVAVRMEGGEALFVVFQGADKILGATHEGGDLTLPRPDTLDILTLDAPWQLHMDQLDGTATDTLLTALSSWHESDSPAIRYFSGTARYSTTLSVKHMKKQARYILRLGDVRSLARVYVNGTEAAHLWRPPFEVDITQLLVHGKNRIEVDVTNMWVNRLVGDEQEPDDIVWGEPVEMGGNVKGSVGRFMAEIPQWLADGSPRPSQNRQPVVTFKYFEKDYPLLPSGLIGPVTVAIVK